MAYSHPNESTAPINVVQSDDSSTTFLSTTSDNLLELPPSVRYASPMPPPFHLVSSLLAAAVLLLAGCANGPSIPSDAKRIGAESDRGRVTLTPGQMLVIDLQRNPSTGFVWQLIAWPSQAVLLSDGTQDFTTAKQRRSKNNVEEQLLRFIAQQPGETNVHLNYIQAGQGPNENTRTFQVHVVVKAD
jgi:predicted secreted protein